MENEFKTDFLGNQYKDVMVPLLWMEITAANVEFETDIPPEKWMEQMENDIWTSYSCKKAVVWWYPEFDFSSGMVKIDPKTIYIDAEIEIQIDRDEISDPEKLSIEVNKDNLPAKIEDEDDGADRERQYAPHTVVFTMDENNKLTNAKVFYS